jgi:hypothetical protein
VKKTKPIAARWIVPKIAMVEKWFDLPFARTRRKANAGLPLPVGGKGALAQIAFPDDGRRQAQFIKAGGRNPFGLSREEYLQLATADTYRMNAEIINSLLAAWAVRAAKSEPQLAKRGERILRARFVARFVEFLLGRAKEARQPSAGEPQEIARRYLLSENWRLTLELQESEDQLPAARARGAWTTAKNAAEKRNAARVRILAAAQRVSPLLRDSESAWIDQILLEPEAKAEKWKRSVIRDALATFQAHYAVQRLLAESKAKP